VARHANAAGLSPAVRAITTSGTGGHVDPTSNDAGDPNPIAAERHRPTRGISDQLTAISHCLQPLSFPDPCAAR